MAILDLAMSAYLQAVPNFANIQDALNPDALAVLPELSRLLSLLPQNLDLADWEDNKANRACMHELFAAFLQLVGVGPAVCTKILHKKRPRLLPIVDSWQLEAFGRNQAGTAEELTDVAFGIRDILRQDDRGEYIKILNGLYNLDPHFPPLSVLRVYDILFLITSNQLPK